MLVSEIKKSSFLNINRFLHAKNSTISFHGTSAGTPLRKLRNITDPYFGEKMISTKEYTKTERILDTKNTVKQAMKVLNKFRTNMQIVEKNIFDAFRFAAPHMPRTQFNDILRLWYQKALIRLKLEEFQVLDEIDKISMSLEPETTFEVRKKTTHCRQVILNDNPFDKFKRKTVIDSIEEINPRSDGEAKVLSVLKKRANYLPTSNTSINAFIVKYAQRRHDEIAKRLIRASSYSIEHVKPDSKGGENSMDNFILASSAANSLRGNMPLKDFIEMFPQIPENTQKYMNDIINAIHEGELKGYQSYPYKIADTLKTESEGLIELDLSAFKYSLSEAELLETKKFKWLKNKN